MSSGNNNMREVKIFETLLSKKGQIQLATQVVKMILKIDDVIEPETDAWSYVIIYTKFKSIIQIPIKERPIIVNTCNHNFTSSRK